MPAIALTDHGALYGAVDFYSRPNQAASSDPRVETYIARTNRSSAIRASRVTGSRSTSCCSRGFHGVRKPRLAGHDRAPRRLLLPPADDKEILRQHSTGLIALSACLQGELARAIQDRGDRGRVQGGARAQEIFGAGNYFLELDAARRPGAEAVLAGFARSRGARASRSWRRTTSHYVHAEDARRRTSWSASRAARRSIRRTASRWIDHPSCI